MTEPWPSADVRGAAARISAASLASAAADTAAADAVAGGAKSPTAVVELGFGAVGTEGRAATLTLAIDDDLTRVVAHALRRIRAGMPCGIRRTIAE